MRVLVAACLMCVVLFYFALCANDMSAGFTSDDAVYLLLADLYTFAADTHLPVYSLLREQALFPPLFPLVLGLTGGGSADPARAALVSVALLLIALTVAGRWILQQTHNLPVSMLLTGLLFLLPGSLILAQEIWSEFLFMLWLYIIFLVAGRDDPLRHHWLILALLIAAATLTRTAGIALLPPFWLLLYINRVRPFWLPAGIATFPFLVWYFVREVIRFTPGYTDTLAATFAAADLTLLSHSLQIELISLYDSMRWLIAGAGAVGWRGSVAGILVIVLLLAATRTLWTKIIALRFDALFCLVYLTMVVVWPYDDVYYVTRFLYPVLPLLLLYAYLGISRNLARERVRIAVAVASLCGFAVSAGPPLLGYTQRALSDVAEELKPYRRDRSWLLAVDADVSLLRNSRFIIETLQKLPGQVAEHECILTVQAPLVMLHAKRITGVLPPADSTNEQFRSGIGICRYILAMPVTDTARAIPEYYPMQRLRAADYEQTTFLADPQAGYGTAIYLLGRIADTIVVE